MILTINTEEPRDIKALQLATQADTWRPIARRADAFEVPSSDGRHVYLTTAETCSCIDSQRGHVCYHRRAIRIYLALREASQPAPARKPVEAPSRFATMSEAELFARF